MNVVAGQETSTRPLALSPTWSGGGKTTKLMELVTSPCGVRMVIGPSDASGGMVAVMRKSELLVRPGMKSARAPVNRTSVAPVKFVPNKVIFAPGIALFGAN